MTPRVSAIIPTYNRERVLRCAVASVLSQPDVELEIVIVDDGSTDGSVALVEVMRAQGAPIVLVKHETNQGVSVARNSGLTAASHPLILFLDSDDYLLPGALAKLIAVLVDDPLRGLAYGWREVQLPEDAREVPVGTHLDDPGPIRKEPFVSGALTRADVVEEIGGFDPALWMHEDLDWLDRITDSTYSMGEFPGVTVHRGFGEDNLTLDLDGMRRSRLLWVRKRLQRSPS